MKYYGYNYIGSSPVVPLSLYSSMVEQNTVNI